MNINRVFLCGRLDRDPEVTTTMAGVVVCRMVVVTTIKRGEAEATEWHRVIAWGELARACAHYSKGQRIHVQGSLQTRAYQGEDKIERLSTEVVVSRVHGLGFRGNGDPVSTP